LPGDVVHKGQKRVLRSLPFLGQFGPW
jgi:hypothetical protein